MSTDRVLPEDVVEDIQEVADGLGHTPNAYEYDEHGQYNHSMAQYRFGSYRSAIEAAGFEPNGPENFHYSKEELWLDLVRVANELGERPSYTQYEEHGEFSEGVYRRRFDIPFASLSAEAYQVSQLDGEENGTEEPDYGTPRGPITGPLADTGDS